MTITPLEMYLITRLNYISNVTTFFAVLIGLILIPLIAGVLGMKASNQDETDPEFKVPYKTMKILSVVFLFCLTTAVFTPSTKEMAAIIVVPEIVQSEKVEKIGNEFYDLALDWMKELHPEKVKSNIENNKQGE